MDSHETCRHCGNPLPQSSSRGGRPRVYCNDQCRWAFHRGRSQRWRPLDQLHQRQTDTRRQRRHLRQEADHLAAAVTADRAAGATWQEIAAVLGTSPDTADRRYQT